ncbi:diguanylate cyclase domain-containing protein [Acidisphaera sp. S103]|uniref:diguanylate cyclase domain-containing protein n=1 Tax=Acidisphaera sp. S103 TaxID=1747223 RepID=UPI00131E8146|nr:diguanylate cyclase [Acidisphaera sp. S103]
MTAGRRRPQPTLLSVLRRAHLNIAIVAVTIVGLSLTLTGAVTLLAYANDSLNLVARAISYNVEAAVVFGDRAAAHDALASIAATEDVAEASVTGPGGRMIAHWETPSQGTFAMLSRMSMMLLGVRPVMMPITHDGALIGNVDVSGSGQNVLRFVLSGLLGVVICQVLIVASAMYLSRRMMTSIVKPLQTLAAVAHAVRRQRDFEQRVPATEITELNDLGENFNALLDELDRWQAHLKIENASLVHKASHDSLTRLPNRAFFETQLVLAIADAERRGMRAAVLFLDCDRFKTINDGFGHAAGDAVLINVATRIKALVRETDLAVRLGGDEFALLIAPVGDAADAVSIADVLLARMRVPISLPSGESIVTSLSIGVAIYPDHALDADTLLHKADQAMYRAKSTQRGSRGVAAEVGGS